MPVTAQMPIATYCAWNQPTWGSWVCDFVEPDAVNACWKTFLEGMQHDNWQVCDLIFKNIALEIDRQWHPAMRCSWKAEQDDATRLLIALEYKAIPSMKVSYCAEVKL
jgi:hypothetical protein